MKKGITITKDTKRHPKKPWLVRWWGAFSPSTGNQRYYSRSFRNKKQAEKFKEELIKQFNAGMPKDQENINLQELINKFAEVKKDTYTNGTMEGYVETFERLQNYFGPTQNIRNITPEQAAQFIANLTFIHPYYTDKQKRFSDCSRNRHLRHAKTLFQLAYDWHYLRHNPFSSTKQVKENTQQWHFIPAEEFSSILKNIPEIIIDKKTEETKPNIRVQAFYSIMYWCGLRSSEAQNLLWTNIDFTNNRINIVNRPAKKDLPPFTVKNKQGRSVPMPSQVILLLKKLRENEIKGCPFVVLNKDSWKGTKGWGGVKAKWNNLWEAGRGQEWKNRFLMNNCLREFQKNCRRAGIITNEKLTIHCLRKSYGTNLANLGTPVHTLKSLMGHSSIRTTMEYYIHSSDSNEKKAVKGLERMGEELGEK